ncbi:Ubiquitin carboxyl-terminal hydrolase 38 [Bagarius yarrelli]|uniref:Ubiquitin carboxyl-terminal hydrolase 38 n=1 Tax=Bagarius yarrelli TaxID=175774 RepID=A0A556TM87_BAGYA|nr:Ubiquitin carboxyl-terminal hydrolase 38 [Bagarius yarrelli]
MDKILEGLVSSSHPLPVKRAIVKKVVEAAEKEVTPEQCQALYQFTARLILLGEDAFQRQVGLQVQEAYARYHRDEFARFLNQDFVLDLLRQGYGPLDRRDPAILDFLHGCLRLLISCPAVLDLSRTLQTEVLRMVCERPDAAFCSKLAALLSDFPQCVSRSKASVLLCQQFVRTFAHFQCPAAEEAELRRYVGHVGCVAALLQGIWKAEPDTLLPSLQEVFAIISSTDPSTEPSIALASLVQHIPLQMITVLIKSLTTDQNVRDASMTQALSRMIDWLSWPLANHVDTWVIALLKGLAAVQKFTILIDVTLLKIELVFNRLWYPIVRRGALAVLSHMMLSFQHSPEAFHLVVPHVVPLVKSLQSDGLPTSKAFLLQFTELIHCMMYQYSGFPDLYDSILEVIKDLPKPSEEKIKYVLNQSAWTSQSNSFAAGLLRITGKSETGKTGLVNLGNTCYLNSIIQVLYMATDFRRNVLSLNLNGSNTLMKKLQLLFAFLAHTQRAAYAPRSFLDVSRPPWFTAGSQQDCTEYLRFLLDRLHEEEKTLRALQTAKPKITSTNTEGTDDAQAQNVSSDPSPSQSNPSDADGDELTLVERMFGGRLSTGIRCLQCHSLSKKEEPFTDLSLAFCPTGISGSSSSSVQSKQGAVNGGSENSEGTAKDERSEERPKTEAVLSLSDLLKYFLAPEILEEDNCYFCERCGSLQRAERAINVVTAPKYLILTLLRFSYDATCHVRRKILDNVSIPLHMHLPVHQHSPSASLSSSSPQSVQIDSPDSGENLAKKLKPSHKESEEGDEGVTNGGLESGTRDWGPAVRGVPYVLCSVVMHSGMSSESGHYYSYSRNSNSTSSNLSFPNPESDSNAVLSEGAAASQETAACAGQDSRDWFLFNDSRVTFTNFQSVQNITSRFPKDTAYVLIYRKKEEVDGQAGCSGATVNGLGFNAEPPLHKDLMDAITKDNTLFLQEQELNARARALQAASTSCSLKERRSEDRTGEERTGEERRIRGRMSGGDVVCSGWLRKSPPEKKLRRYAWKKRWFVLRSGRLTGDPDVLEYYKNDHVKKPIRVIDLNLCEQVDAGLSFNKKELEHSFIFDIKTIDRVFYLVADTEDEMNKWVRCICDICGFNPTDTDDSVKASQHAAVSGGLVVDVPPRSGLMGSSTLPSVPPPYQPVSVGHLDSSSSLDDTQDYLLLLHCESKKPEPSSGLEQEYLLLEECESKTAPSDSLHDCSKSTSSEPDCNDNLPSHRTPTSSTSTAKHASVNGFFSSQPAPLYDSPPARGASMSADAQGLYQLPRSRSQDTVLLPKSAPLSGTTDSDAADVYVFNTPARKPSFEAQLRNMSVSYDIPSTPGSNCTYQVPRTAGGAEASASDVVPPPRPPKPSVGPAADRSPTDTYVVPRSVSETDSNYCVPSGPGGSKTLRSNTIGPVDSSRLRKASECVSDFGAFVSVKPAPLDIKPVPECEEFITPVRSPITKSFTRDPSRFHAAPRPPSVHSTASSTDSEEGDENYVPMQYPNMPADEPKLGLPMNAKVEYLDLDLDPGKSTRKSNGTGVAVSERVDYVMVDQERTQALKSTREAWNDGRQSTENDTPSKGAK